MSYLTCCVMPATLSRWCEFPFVRVVTAVTHLSRVCETVGSHLWSEIEGRCHVCDDVA